MAYFPSNQGFIGIGKQSVKGTAVAPQRFIKYITDESTATFESETLREGGDGQWDKTSVKTIHTNSISFSCYARPSESANLYAALLGSDTKTITTTPFVHTIVPQAFQVTTIETPWMTMNRQLVSSTNSKTEVIKDIKLSAITLEAEAGQPVSMSVEGTGLSSILTTSTSTATYESGNPYSFYNGTYTVNGSGSTDIKSFNISVRAINDEENQTTAITRNDIINHRFETEVTLGINYTDYQLMAKANYTAGTTIDADFSDGAAIINLSTGTGTSIRQLKLTIPKVRLQPINIPLNAEVATIEQTMAGMAFKQDTTALITIESKIAIATTLPL